MKKCYKCNIEYLDDENYCEKCGSKLDEIQHIEYKIVGETTETPQETEPVQEAIPENNNSSEAVIDFKSSGKNLIQNDTKKAKKALLIFISSIAFFALLGVLFNWSQKSASNVKYHTVPQTTIGATTTTTATTSSYEDVTVNLKNIKIGQVIQFGRYEQDNNISNGKEPLEWIVIDAQEGKALLLCKNCIDAKKYNDTFGKYVWLSCSLRSWLNRDFLNEAFNTNERAVIKSHDNENPDNKEYGTLGGSNTYDTVFLLSISEFNAYVKGTEFASSEQTAYAQANGNSFDTWWLRSPGQLQNHASAVNYGKISSTTVDSRTVGVRPVIIVEVDSIAEAQTTKKRETTIILNSLDSEDYEDDEVSETTTTTTTTAHKHTLNKPTCQRAAYCKECGESVGEPCDHRYNNEECVWCYRQQIKKYVFQVPSTVVVSNGYGEPTGTLRIDSYKQEEDSGFLILKYTLIDGVMKHNHRSPGFFIYYYDENGEKIGFEDDYGAIIQYLNDEDLPTGKGTIEITFSPPKFTKKIIIENR